MLQGKGRRLCYLYVNMFSTVSFLQAAHKVPEFFSLCANLIRLHLRAALALLAEKDGAF